MDIHLQLIGQTFLPRFSHAGFKEPIILILSLLSCVDLNFCKSNKIWEERLSNCPLFLSFTVFDFWDYNKITYLAFSLLSLQTLPCSVPFAFFQIYHLFLFRCYCLCMSIPKYVIRTCLFWIMFLGCVFLGLTPGYWRTLWWAVLTYRWALPWEDCLSCSQHPFVPCSSLSRSWPTLLSLDAQNAYLLVVLTTTKWTVLSFWELFLIEPFLSW